MQTTKGLVLKVTHPKVRSHNTQRQNVLQNLTFRFASVFRSKDGGNMSLRKVGTEKWLCTYWQGNGISFITRGILSFGPGEKTEKIEREEKKRINT